MDTNRLPIIDLVKLNSSKHNKYTLKGRHIARPTIRPIVTPGNTSALRYGLYLEVKTIFLVYFILIFCVQSSCALMYNECGNRTVEKGQVFPGDSGSTLYFAVVLATTEKNEATQKCNILNWKNVRNLLAIQWVVDKLNSFDNHNRSFIPGYKIDFQVFDDCGQPDVVFHHISHIMETLKATQFSECPKLTKQKETPYFAVLTLSDASVTETILQVSKMLPVPVVNPKVDLSSFQNYGNFVGFSPSIDFQLKAVLQLVQKLNWTYVGLIYSDNVFGQQIKDRLLQQAVKFGICFAFYERASNIVKIESGINNARAKTQGKHLGIMYQGDKANLEMILKKKIPKTHWIILDSFGTTFEMSKNSQNLLDGSLTFYPVNIQIKEFENFYTEKIQNLFNSINTNAQIDYFIKNLLERTNEHAGNIPPVDELRDDVQRVMDAVYILVKAKKETCRKIAGSCTKAIQPYFSNTEIVVDYKVLADFSPREFADRNRLITVFNKTRRNEKSSNPRFNILNFWNGKFKTVGFISEDGKFELSLGGIQMTDEKDVIVTGDNLPKSLCSKTCDECQQPELSGRIAYIPGNILLLGIFSIHDSGPGFQCGNFRKDSTDAIASEAFLYAIKRTRVIFPNITVGGIAIDDCYNSIQTSMNITLILSGAKKLYDPYTGNVIDPSKIVAVIGPLSSGVTKSVADLLTHEKLPMVSYAASSYDLDDRISYPYFLRTVPSDVQQVQAIVHLLVKLEWRYVGVIYANNNYGAKAKELFLSTAQKNRICVSSPKRIEESSEKAEPSELESVLDNLMKDQLKIVVYFGTNSRVNDLVETLKSKNMKNRFVFIGSETWGTTQVTDLQVVAGSLTLTLDSSQTADDGSFKAYLKKLTLKPFSSSHPSSSSINNPFFNMYWYSFHKCDPPNGFRNKYKKPCTGTEHFSDTDARFFARDQRSVQTMNAVYVVHEGIRRFQMDECRYMKRVPCDRFSTNINDLVSIIKSIQLNVSDDKFEVFDSDGNGKNTFNIHNIKRNKEGKYVYEFVGDYNIEYNLALRRARLRFYDQRLQEIPYVNVSCVSPHKCCDPVTSSTAGSPRLKDSIIRPVDVVILSLILILFVFLFMIGILFFFWTKKQKESSSNVLESRNKEMTDGSSLSTKRGPTVYIRSEESRDESSSSYQGVVTYQIPKPPTGYNTEQTQNSQTRFVPNPSPRSGKVFTNIGFEQDDVFLFPDTASQSPSTSYEEIATPQSRARSTLPQARPQSEPIKEAPPIKNARFYSDGNGHNYDSAEKTFII